MATAWLKEVFGAKLKEIVTTGNWPWCAMVRGLDIFSKCASADSGIGEEADVVPEPPPDPDEVEED